MKCREGDAPISPIERPGGGGEYPTQDGFGWTNGVTRKLMALYPADADAASVDQCPGPDGG